MPRGPRHLAGRHVHRDGAQSDVYSGIIGLPYGSAVRDRPDVSYTEMEFEAACEGDQLRLIFLIHADSVHLPPRRRQR